MQILLSITHWYKIFFFSKILFERNNLLLQSYFCHCQFEFSARKYSFGTKNNAYAQCANVNRNEEKKCLRHDG